MIPPCHVECHVFWVLSCVTCQAPVCVCCHVPSPLWGCDVIVFTLIVIVIEGFNTSYPWHQEIHNLGHFTFKMLENKMQFSNTDWWEVPLQNGLKMSLWAFGSSLVTIWPISGRKKKLKKTRENRENFAISVPWCTNDLNFCVCSSFFNTKLFC